MMDSSLASYLFNPRDAQLSALQQEIAACRRCPRLIEHCAEVARVKRRAYLGQPYWGGPVPSFGDPAARLLIIGLAPGAHGANRTGRVFTGDKSGDLLYRVLHKTGFATRPESTWRNDGLELRGAYITCAAHCAPPGNKPAPDELLTRRKPCLLHPASVSFRMKIRGLRRAGKQAKPPAPPTEIPFRKLSGIGRFHLLS